MKYALFEFVVEKTFEIGETRWIVREDPTTFNNVSWDFEKEVMVYWPREYTKLSKKIIRSSIDPKSVETTSWVAKVITFDDVYDDIRQHAVRYSETGTTATPPQGRGKRISKKNSRYFESGGSGTDDGDDDNVDDDDDDDSDTVINKRTISKPTKKQKTSIPTKKELEKLKEKFRTSKNSVAETEDDERNNKGHDDSDGEINFLRKQNASLTRKLERKEKEVQRLHSVIKNTEYMPSLQNVVKDLKKQVELLSGSTISSKSASTPLSLKFKPSSSSQSSSQPSSTHSSPCASASELEVAESDFITLCPNVVIAKGQHKVLRSKANVKDFTYALMSMLWSRDVLCTHNISGKVSNAFKEHEAKPQLDPEKVNSICEFASKRYGVTVKDVEKIMKSKINNIVKVIKAKEKLVREKSESS